MTPEQLKEYVEAALKQRDSFAIVYFIAVPILTFLAAYVGGYAKEKAKNTATKEDIAEITKKIEDSKSVYTERLEQLKADLLARSHFSQVRYEREMKIYDDIWQKLSGLKQAVLSLRPIVDVVLKEGETEESRKQVRAKDYVNANAALSESVEHHRPFYPHEIWSELVKLLDLCWGEAVQFRFADQQRDWEKYWDKATQNSKAINTQVEQICEAIRTRLTKFDAA